MKNSEIAERAAEVLEIEGWTKDTYGNVSHGYCLMGATFRAMGWKPFRAVSRELDARATTVLWPALGRGEIWADRPDRESGTLIVVNDEKIFNKRQAIDFVMKAAKYWRNKGE